MYCLKEKTNHPSLDEIKSARRVPLDRLNPPGVQGVTGTARLTAV
jgi:hypothetical protein